MRKTKMKTFPTIGPMVVMCGMALTVSALDARAAVISGNLSYELGTCSTAGCGGITLTATGTNGIRIDFGGGALRAWK